MKIKRFKAQEVYGFMDFDVAFNDDLTFLTGINGSGKTTVVEAVSALVTPSLINLACTDFKSMEIQIRNVQVRGEERRRRGVTIRARKSEDQLILDTSGTEKKLTIPLLLPDFRTRPRPTGERELEYYQQVEAENRHHPALNLIRNLPSPMVLGIERRGRVLFPEESRRTALISRRRRRTRNVFDTPLSVNLLEASDLAEERYRAIEARQRELTGVLRKDILLSAVKYEEFRSERSLMRIPRIDIESARRGLQGTLQRLGIPSREVQLEVDPFFSKLQELSTLLKDTDVAGLPGLLESDDERVRHAITEWIVNYPQFNRIMRILSYVDEYMAESQRLSEPIDRYLGIVNGFLKDSNKQIVFDETGSLCVRVGESDPVPVTSLSSGEGQIVVIITHLSFNPLARRANVFIVDEPELSLHVRWQELFVEAVRKANPDLQIILATHSPSIILDDTEHCVDLSGGIP